MYALEAGEAAGLPGKNEVELFQWIEVYWSGRMPKGTFSKWVEVTSRVPQGSILGSSLYLIWIYLQMMQRLWSKKHGGFHGPWRTPKFAWYRDDQDQILWIEKFFDKSVLPMISSIYIWCPIPQGDGHGKSLHLSVLTLHACLAYTIPCIFTPFLSLQYSPAVFPHATDDFSLALT